MSSSLSDVTIDSLRRERDELAQQLAYLNDLRAQNRLIKIGYGYTPKCRDWAETPAIAGLAAHMQRKESGYLQRLSGFMRYLPELARIAADGDASDASKPAWRNGWMPGFDAITLYGMLAERNPRWYVEIGSGHSTKFARQAIRDHKLRTRIISIDPVPRSEIDQLCDEVIRKPCEDVDRAFFNRLTVEDMLFIDNSHIAFMNSDVMVFFSEILPSLPPGLIYSLHDIYLPYDYPDIWNDRWYNEQYLLLAYLAGGGQGDRILLPNYYLSSKPAARQALGGFYDMPEFAGVEDRGGLFWMERVGHPPWPA